MSAPPSPHLLVVIPAYNEEQAVGGVVEEVRAAVPHAHCLVVDDGSTDRTARAASDAGAWVLTLPFNLGVGGAMRAGFRYAKNRGFDTVVQVDGDGQHDPADIHVLVEALGDADIAIGARFAGVGQYDTHGPRRWAMRFLAGVVGHVAGRPLTDVTSGFKAMGPAAVALFAHTYPAEYLGDTVEALIVAARAGLRIDQRPVAMRQRRAGEPSQGVVTASLYLMRAVIAMFVALIRPRTPVPVVAEAEAE